MKQINEIKRMQRIAGLITESEYRETEENEASSITSNPLKNLTILLNQAIKIADENIEKAENFDLEDFSQTLEKYVDQLKKISKFKVYNEEGINEKYPSKVWNWDINEFGKYNPTTKTFTMVMDGDGYADYMDTEFPNWLKNEKIADKGTKKYREDIKNAVEEEYGPGITINGEGFSY